MAEPGAYYTKNEKGTHHEKGQKQKESEYKGVCGSRGAWRGRGGGGVLRGVQPDDGEPDPYHQRGFNQRLDFQLA